MRFSASRSSRLRFRSGAWVGSGVAGLVLAMATFASPAFAAPASMGPHRPEAPPRAPASPAECAAEFHARFPAIKEGPLARLKSLKAEAGSADPSLPGAFLFPLAKRSGEARAALRSASMLAELQGRNLVPTGANDRWIASRIQEDLTDFLSQGPSPFLCAGIGNYLETLREYASRLGLSPNRLERDTETQAAAASSSVFAALGAMRPAPLPRFAPADRPDPSLLSDALRKGEALGSPRAVMGPPMLLAARSAGEVKVSEGSYDPDLPPLSEDGLRHGGGTEAMMKALDRLERAARANGLLIETGQPVVAVSAAPEMPTQRPVLQRLAALKSALGAGTGSDALARADLVVALSDIEALDYLETASAKSVDPTSAALADVFDAIDDAHRDACRCAG